MDNGASSYRRFLNGERDALTEIIKEYKDGLIFFLCGFCGNISCAEDMAQETFLKLYVKKPKFNGKSSFKTWLYSIGRNTAVDFIRRDSRMQTVSADESAEYADFCSNPEFTYFDSEKKQAVHMAMLRLKPEYRQILWLVYFEEMSSGEASKILKKSANSTAVLLHRAKNLLKSELLKEGFTYEDL